ncbi:MAG: hypothetical protein AAB544_00400 [Patescibacteria group bacterium]
MRRYVYWVVAEEEAELVLFLGWVPSQDPWGLGFPEIASFHEAAVAEGAEEMSAEMEELAQQNSPHRVLPLPEALRHLRIQHRKALNLQRVDSVVLAFSPEAAVAEEDS